MTPKIAVIIFPGTNCEIEVLRACKWAGMNAELFRWNDDYKLLKKYDGFVLPGGFSYEDRGRSGVVASKDKILESIRKEAKKGKPVIGICNGAQVLIESGFIPGISYEYPEMALAWNERIKKGKILGVGFYNDWVNIKSDGKKNRSAFNWFGNDTIMRIPIAHGEGRFTTKNKDLLKTLIKNDQTLFRYCDEKGNTTDEFPINPNGAIHNLAGVCNKHGNVLALMPHPERTRNGLPIFKSIAQYIKAGPKPMKVTKKEAKPTHEKIPHLRKKPDIVIKSTLIITDNEERTIENTMKNKGFKDLKLKRKVYFGIYTKPKVNLKKLAAQIIKSGEILNLNKEIPTIEIGGKSYHYDGNKGLAEFHPKENKRKRYFVLDLDNYQGKSTMEKLKPYIKNKEIVKVEKGIYWSILMKKEQQIDKLIHTHIFNNPHSATILALQ